jgi:hypothetical protein
LHLKPNLGYPHRSIGILGGGIVLGRLGKSTMWELLSSCDSGLSVGDILKLLQECQRWCRWIECCPLLISTSKCVGACLAVLYSRALNRFQVNVEHNGLGDKTETRITRIINEDYRKRMLSFLAMCGIEYIDVRKSNMSWFHALHSVYIAAYIRSEL